jgi:hypothetical protein
MDLAEIQVKHQENRGDYQSQSKVRLRTAKVDDANKLLKAGVSPHEVSDLLSIPLSEVARIEEYNQRKRKFLTTGSLELLGPEEGGYFAILQR